MPGLSSGFRNNLFLINALIEGVFGVIVLLMPSFMFADADYNPTTLTAARMAGSAMLTLGVTSFEGYKTVAARPAIGRGMLVYHLAILLLGFYGFIKGGYLPGPDVEGVPVIMKFLANAATHASLAFGFFRYVTSRK